MLKEMNKCCIKRHKELSRKYVNVTWFKCNVCNNHIKLGPESEHLKGFASKKDIDHIFGKDLTPKKRKAMFKFKGVDTND